MSLNNLLKVYRIHAPQGGSPKVDDHKNLERQAKGHETRQKPKPSLRLSIEQQDDQKAGNIKLKVGR